MIFLVNICKVRRELSMEKEKVYELLKEAQTKSYSPYSKFRVGAILVMKDGKIILGANLENAAYGLCICAERTALFQYKLLGYKPEDIEIFGVIGDTDDYISPCGSCRQVMAEFLNKDTKVWLFNSKGDYKEVTVEDLLPFSFSKDDMK